MISNSKVGFSLQYLYLDFHLRLKNQQFKELREIVHPSFYEPLVDFVKENKYKYSE